MTYCLDRARCAITAIPSTPMESSRAKFLFVNPTIAVRIKELSRCAWRITSSSRIPEHLGIVVLRRCHQPILGPCRKRYRTSWRDRLQRIVRRSSSGKGSAEIPRFDHRIAGVVGLQTYRYRAVEVFNTRERQINLAQRVVNCGRKRG